MVYQKTLYDRPLEISNILVCEEVGVNMCGICGIVSNTYINPDRLLVMRDSLKHRGPDDRGAVLISSIYKNRTIFFRDLPELKDNKKLINDNYYNIALAHRRLSVIDLSIAGRQPMSNEDQSVWITYNGEIYNFKELQHTLKSVGHIFKSNTDTEVIIHAYEHWGVNCLAKLNGMFSFAIFDGRTSDKKIFMARDRAGKKPFYYLLDDDVFCFASELKCMIKGLEKKFELDYEAINYYLAMGYIPESLCILKGCKKLPPAHAAIYNLESKNIKAWRYWNLPHYTENSEQGNIHELVEELQFLFDDSVKIRMESDVPLGIFLSGGVDSSLVTAVASSSIKSGLKTFTVAFPNMGKFDESEYAKIISDSFTTEHHTLDGTFNLEKVLDEVSKFIDEPIADSSFIPTYIISKLTKRYVTVVLGGDGGDELFGGYKHYQNSLIYKKLLEIFPNKFFRFLSKMFGELPAGIMGRNKLFSLRGGYLETGIWGTSFFDFKLRGKIIKRDIIEDKIEDFNKPEKWKLGILNNGFDEIDKLTRLDFHTYLPEDILTKVDRASMACSLEVRAPWLDHRIIEFAFSKVPSNYKVDQNKTRKIQKLLAKKLLPKELNLERKQGFSIPIDHWFRSNKCEVIRRNAEFLPDIINKRELEKLIQGEIIGRANGARLYSLLNLAVFHKNLNYNY